MPIKMSKAIELLSLNIKDNPKKMPPDVKHSLSLAISTMEAVQYIRKGGSWSLTALFPNEAPWQEQP